MSHEFIGVDELCEMTGYSRQTVYQLIWRREVPCYKPTRGKVLFSRAEIEAWIESGRRATRGEIAEKAAALLNEQRGAK